MSTERKFTVDDMVKMQLDLVDVSARTQVPAMIAIAQSVASELTADQIADLHSMTSVLADWDCEMSEESVQATVYQFTLGEIQASLFHAYEKDLKARIMYTESRVEFAEFTMTFLKSVAEKGADSKYQILCKEAYPEYTGPNTCEYNIARSFVKVK